MYDLFLSMEEFYVVVFLSEDEIILVNNWIFDLKVNFDENLNNNSTNKTSISAVVCKKS